MRTRIVATTAFFLLTGLTTQANAIPTLRLVTDAGSDITIADGGVGDMSAAGDGVVLFTGWLAGWDINVSTGLSRPAIGSASEPMLDLNSVNVSSRGTAGLLSIWFTDTGFTGVNQASAIAEIGGTTSGSVNFQAFYDASNTAFGQANSLIDETLSSTPFAASSTSTISAPELPYSLTLLVNIFHDGKSPSQVSSFDATVKVPEPSSLLLTAAGLLAMALAFHRRPRAGAI